MKKRNYKKLLRTAVAIFAAVLLTFTLSNFNPAMALDATELNDGFRRAREVSSGETINGGNIQQDEGDFYKINLSAGKQLHLWGSAKAGSENPTNFKISLYDAGGKLISTNQERANGEKTVEAFYYKGNMSSGSEEQLSNPQIVYIVAENTMGGDKIFIENYTMNLEILERTDAGLYTDAGDSRQIAAELDISQIKGSYNQNFIGKNECGKNKYCSTDEKDFFGLDLKDGEEIKVLITPSKDLIVTSYLVDENGVIDQSSKKTSANAGAITEITGKSKSDGGVFLAVESEKFGEYGFSYEVTTQKLSTETTNTTNTTNATNTTAANKTANKTNIANTVQEKSQDFFGLSLLTWIIIGASAAVVIALIIFIMIRVRAKKKMQEDVANKLKQEIGQVGKKTPENLETLSSKPLTHRTYPTPPATPITPKEKPEQPHLPTPPKRQNPTQPPQTSSSLPTPSKPPEPPKPAI